MRIGSLVMGLALVLAFGLAPKDAVAQDAPAVNNVLFIDTGGDLPRFLELFTRRVALDKKYGRTLRGFRAATVAELQRTDAGMANHLPGVKEVGR